MKSQIKRARQIIKEGKIKKSSDTIWEVDSQYVRVVIEPGRRLLTCSCMNHSMYPVKNPVCVHKMAVMLYEGTFDYQMKLERLIKDLENAEKISMHLENVYLIEQLKDLRGFI